MTIHHVLDTGAVYLLHDKHRPPLWGDLEKDVADRAAAALRAATRDRCDKCSNFVRPSLVDAVVMAFAHRHVSNGDQAVVYTGDMGDMEKLRDALFAGVTLKSCS